MSDKTLPKRSSAKNKKAADDLSGALAESLEVAAGAATPADARSAWERKQTARRESEALFDTAAPELEPGFERVVSTIFGVTDVSVAHARLLAELSLGERRNDRGSLVKALDDAQERAREAHQLYCCACDARKGWELDAEVVGGGLRTAAVDALQSEKDRGERNKQITEADVSAKVAAMFPDEYRRLAIKGERVKRMVESLENLASRWAARASNLEVLLGKSR